MEDIITGLPANTTIIMDMANTSNAQIIGGIDMEYNDTKKMTAEAQRKDKWIKAICILVLVAIASVVYSVIYCPEQPLIIGIMDFLVNVLFTASVYALPVVIYRYWILKKPADKKKAKKFVIIFSIIAFIVMSALLLFALKTGSVAGASILLWAYIDYRILIGGKEKHKEETQEREGITEEVNTPAFEPSLDCIVCSRCGNEFASGSLFCPKCGKKVKKQSKPITIGKTPAIIAIVVVAAVLATSIGFNIHQKLEIDSLTAKAVSLSVKINDYDSALTALKDSYIKLGNDYDSLAKKYNVKNGWKSYIDVHELIKEVRKELEG